MTIAYLTYADVPADLNPGIQPVEFGVLVFPLEIANKTASGILIAQDTKELEELSGTVGVVVALSDQAGKEVWGHDAPRVGDRVVFLRHAGQLVQGDDGRKYRLMKDKDVLGVRRPAAVAETIEQATRRERGRYPTRRGA